MRIGCIRITTPRVRQATAVVVLGLCAAGFVWQPPTATAASVRQAGVLAASDDGAAGSDGVTVPAPAAGPGATVTVSKTTNLVNETVLVSWAGFRPSSATRLANAGDSFDGTTQRPVRVYECRGADPDSSDQCYGSLGFDGVPAGDGTDEVPAVSPYEYTGQTDKFAVTPDGPANWQDNVTRADGTGEVAIQVFTKRESATLGCDVDTPCSLVVVPNYGRPAGATEGQLDAPWAWARRTVVPLGFRPVSDACPLAGSALRVEGSPMVADILASWRSKTCVLASDPVTLDYTAIGEPQTRGDVASQTTDTGLVIDPLPTADAQNAGVVYAPVAATGLVIAYQIDDANGKPIRDLDLDARLVAKMITGSYRTGGDPATAGNPYNIFADPELQALNPGVQFPDGSPGNHPLILGDLSDTTGALTRWLASDPDAAAFLAGTPDPWGMHVNDNYRGISLPFSTFPLLDPLLTTTFAPVQNLDELSRQLSIAQFPGGSSEVVGGVTATIKPPRQNPGQRQVIGIIDASSAQRFRMATASIRNASGAFVAPTAQSIAAGIAHSTVNADGVTRTVDLTDKDPDIYPLSLLVSAALSTKASADERQQMADMLSYVAGPGQVVGDEVGQLPVGNAPLSGALVDQVLAARAAVLAGASAAPDPTPSASPSAKTHPSSSPSASPTADPTSPSDAPSDGGSGTPSDVTGPAPTDAAPSTTVADVPVAAAAGEQPVMVTVASQVAAKRLVILPLIAVLALLSLLGGPVLMWMSQNGRGPQWLRR